MKKVYPNKENITFIICDDIRIEAGNKFALLGVYAGGDIVLQNNKLPINIASLAFYFNFLDGEGKFNTRFKLIDPDGEVLMETNLEPSDKKKDKRLTVILKISPFNIKKLGQYTIDLFLDKKIYEKSFVVQ